MSRRKIAGGLPDEARRTQYQALEASGEAMEALWEALARLQAQGFDIGTKAGDVLHKRDKIKQAIPKKK